MSRLGRFLRCNGGAAAVEFAVILPLMLLILAGTTDLGLRVHSKMTLQSAVNSGLQYAMKSQGSDLETLKKVILNELGDASADIQTKVICECQSVEKACGLPCKVSKQKFLRVDVSEAHSSMFGASTRLQSHFQVHTGEGT